MNQQQPAPNNQPLYAIRTFRDQVGRTIEAQVVEDSGSSTDPDHMVGATYFWGVVMIHPPGAMPQELRFRIKAATIRQAADLFDQEAKTAIEKIQEKARAQQSGILLPRR